MSHGDYLQGIKEPARRAWSVGRGTLTRVPPLKTVKSYCPYPMTLFDNIK